MGFLVRKTLKYATITLHMTAKENEQGVLVVTSEQTITGNIKGTTEVRTLDWEERGHEDNLFGKVVGQTKFAEKADGDGSGAPVVPVVDVLTRVADAGEQEALEKFLRGETLADGKTATSFEVQQGDAEAEHPFLHSWVKSVKDGWTAEQIWGFEIINGERRHTRRAVVAKKDKVVKARLVYAYQP
ncbi:hypothetical protein KEM52_004650 [Ascosphaera acerosa]|nr:hypothetical protein KEM52_004650 [Ascosphaera acerosa]